MTGSRRRGAPPGAVGRRLITPPAAAPGKAVGTASVRTPFEPIRLTEIRSLAAPVFDLELEPGTQLLTEGVAAGTFFVLRGGTALLVRNECPVSTLGAGDCFGELDSAVPQPQAYGVITASPVRLLAFSSFGIGRACDAIPGVADRLREAIAQPPVMRPAYITSPTRSRRAAASRTVTVL